MSKLGKMVRRMALLAGLSAVVLGSSGCTLVGGFAKVTHSFAIFWKTTPLIPVSPYFSEKIEDVYWEEERYDRVPILDPVEGEHAPLFCLDPPSPDQVMRHFKKQTSGGFPFLAETVHNNMRIVVEPIVDRVGECRFYPMVGPARVHHCHWKCTVYFDKIKRSDWPVPFLHRDETKEVIYIDKNYLIRCAGPLTQ